MGHEAFKENPDLAKAAALDLFGRTFGAKTEGGSVRWSSPSFHFRPDSNNRCHANYGILVGTPDVTAQLDHPDNPHVHPTYYAVASAQAKCGNCGQTQISLSAVAG